MAESSVYYGSGALGDISKKKEPKVTEVDIHQKRFYENFAYREKTSDLLGCIRLKANYERSFEFPPGTG